MIINKYLFFSDITIKLRDQEIPAHKFILSARTDFFSESILTEVTILGKTWKNIWRKIMYKYIYINIIKNIYVL